MPETSDDRLIGQLIDRRYRVLRRLGGGGMGTVYEVEHSLLLDRRALKLIKLELAQEPGYRQRFFREAQWLNQSRHPHIVAVHDFQDDPEHGLFIVMELVRGANLKALLQERGRLPYAETLRIGREVALALEHVHRLGRVHRDVKPANILVEEGSGRAVVTDFGIAKDLASSGEETLTQTHEVVGTLNYASPEQIGGDKDLIDERSDIYSLGAVIFEMYAGRHYGGIGSVSRLKYPEPPPEEFRLVVRACLELDAERRIPSATELIRRLEECEHALHLQAGPGVASEPGDLAAGAAAPRPSAGGSAETEVTRATVVGTETGAPTPPSPPSEGTATLQQREAENLRRQVLEAQIEELRQGIDRVHGECLGLQRHLSDFGISAAGFTALDTLAEQLGDVDLEPDLERRRARLEALSDELTQGRASIEGALVGAADDAVRDPEARLQQIAALGDELAPPAELASAQSLLATSRQHFVAGRWNDGLETLGGAGRALGDLRAAVASRAGDIVSRTLRDAADTIREIEELLPPGEPAPDLDEARAGANALIEGEQPREACASATRFADEMQARLRSLAAARDEARSRRDAAQAAGRTLDPAAAEVAAAELEEARLAGARGEAAQTRRDFAAAAAEFSRQADLYGEAGLVLEESRRQNASALRDDVRALREQVAALGIDATAVQPALDRLRDADAAFDRSDWQISASAYSDAGAALRRLRDDHQLAEEKKAARRAEAEQALLGLMERAEAAPEELVGPARDSARILLEGERPADFAAELAALTRAAEELRRALEQESSHEEATAAKARAAEARQALTALPVQDVELQRVDRLLEDADAAARQRRWADAAAAYAGAGEEARRLEAEVRRRQQEERVAAERAGAEEARAQAEAADAGEVAEGQLQRAETIWLQAQQAEVQSDLDAALRLYGDAAAEFRGAAVAAERSWAERLEGAEAGVRLAIDAAAAQPDDLFGSERDDAAALLRGDGPRRARERIAALESARAALHGAVDRRAARDAALAASDEAAAAFERLEPLTPSGEELDPARRLSGEAQESLSRRDWEAAADAFAQTVAALAHLEQQLRTRREREQALRGALEQTAALPEELAAAARAAAEELLAGARPAVFADEIAALEDATARLEQLSQQLPTYANAVESRQAGAAARERVFARAPKRKLRRPVEAALAEAATAERAGDWSGAVAAYERALPLLEALEQTLQEPKPASRVVPITAAALALAALAAVLVVYQPWSSRPAGEPGTASRPAESKGREQVAAKPPAAVEAKPAPVEAKPPAPEAKPAPVEERPAPAPAAPVEQPPAVEQHAAAPAAVNHAPSITSANPKPERPIVASVGDTVSLSATASDADNDPLTYSWTVDGKHAGENKPSLEMKVTGAHEIALTTSDGKEQDVRKWKIALGALKLDAAPAKLDALRFTGSQEFALTPARGQSLEGVKVAWAVDGQKVSDGSKFLFQADDPKYVRIDPIKVSATASNDQGQSYSREWKFTVRPPAPLIEKSTPPSGEVSGDAGSPIQFEVAANEPVGGQRLAYVFSVDGREQQKGPKSSFILTPAEDQSATVAVKVEDNFQQASAPKTWKVQVSGITGRAREWLDQYERAFQSRNAAKIAELRGLGAAEAQKLERVFAAQQDLQVSFNAAKVEAAEGNRSRVSYEMTQSFTGPDGRAQRSRSSCSHLLALQNGRLTDTSQTPCSRLE